MINEIQLLGALELGLIFGFIAYAVYLSLRILQFPDMTVDGSFPLGAGIAAIAILHGFNPWIATALACIGGALAGALTAWLTMRWKILHLLSGILTMTALMSINLRIMHGPNLTLFQQPLIFTSPTDWGLSMQQATLGLLVVLLAATAMLLHRFLISQQGLAMRAVGNNIRMSQAMGISPKKMIILGLALANALVSLAGALFAQAQGFADVSMGTGTLIEGLAAVIIGETLLPSRKLSVAFVRCLLGSIFYRLVIVFALNLDGIGLQASDLKLVTAALVGFAMIAPQLRMRIHKIRRRYDSN